MKPMTIAEVQEIIHEETQIYPQGGGTKTALAAPPTAIVPTLDLSGLSGVLAYDPGEYTFTALAGTPIQDIKALLAEQGQYLPFDPILGGKGATLGGVVAAGTSGPGRYRYGGVRDFLIGIQFVDGLGRLVRGGGKVVKNAAGFDLPKLMVGSLGRLGILVELTFKVFPQPQAYATLQVDFNGLHPAMEAIQQLTTSHLEMDALDLNPPGQLLIRLGGLPEALPARLQRMQDFLKNGADSAIQAIEILEGEAEEILWQNACEFKWVPPGWGLIKIPLTPGRVLVLEERIDGRGAKRRYSVGGNIGWVAWSPEEAGISEAQAFFNTPDSILTRLDLPGLALQGPAGHPLLGLQSGQSLIHRIKQALDPNQKFIGF